MNSQLLVAVALTLMNCLHWRCLLAKLLATATLDCTCLGHLGQCDTDRIVSIYATPPKVAKASKACHCHVSLSPGLSRQLSPMETRLKRLMIFMPMASQELFG